jgi:hypothetical protein
MRVQARTRVPPVIEVTGVRGDAAPGVLAAALERANPGVSFTPVVVVDIPLAMDQPVRLHVETPEPASSLELQIAVLSKDPDPAFATKTARDQQPRWTVRVEARVERTLGNSREVDTVKGINRLPVGGIWRLNTLAPASRMQGLTLLSVVPAAEHASPASASAAPTTGPAKEKD